MLSTVSINLHPTTLLSARTGVKRIARTNADTRHRKLRFRLEDVAFE